MRPGKKCLLFYCIWLSVIFLCHGKDKFFNDDENLTLPRSYNITWMAGIEDFRTLSLITFPGTHDSMALTGGPEAECQALPLRDQLRAGIRFLDLKVFGLCDSLYVMPGVMHQYITLKEVLNTVRAFLSDFKTEVVLIRVQPESFEKNVVNKLVQNLIAEDRHVWMTSRMPSMGQVRGKMVFLQDSTFTLGISLIDTDGKGSNKVSHIKDKDNKIIKQLNRATKACGGDNAVLTYTGDTGFGVFWRMFLTPKRVAEKVNPWLSKYLRHFYLNHRRPCFGIIAMDFPDLGLIQTVISLNWW